MRLVELAVTEEIHFLQNFPVEDDFDVEDPEAVEALWIREGNKEQIDGVSACWITVTRIDGELTEADPVVERDS